MECCTFSKMFFRPSVSLLNSVFNTTHIHIVKSNFPQCLSSLAYRSMASHSSPMNQLDASKLEITLNPNPKSLPPLKDLVFGRWFTDHMLEVNWDEATGWETPHIRPFSNLSLHPACSSLHYGLEVENSPATSTHANNYCIFASHSSALFSSLVVQTASCLFIIFLQCDINVFPFRCSKD